MAKTIAIFRTGGIGDVILSTVSINIIKDKLPDANIIWFGRESTNSLIKEVFSDVDIYEIASENSYSKNLSLIKSSAKNIDAIIDLQNSARTIILGRWAAIHFKCSYTTWNKYSIERSVLVIQSLIRGRKLKFDLFKKELPNRYEAMALCTVNALNKLGTGKVNYQGQRPNFPFYSANEQSTSVAIGLGAKFQTKGLPLTQLEKVLRWPESLQLP